MTKVLVFTTIALAFSMGALLVSVWVHWRVLEKNKETTKVLTDSWENIRNEATVLFEQYSEFEEKRWTALRDDAKHYVEKFGVVSKELLQRETAALAKEKSNNQTKESLNDR